MRVAQVLHVAALLAWSWLLVKSNPFPEVAKELANWGDWATFLSAKALHAGVYATLTAGGILLYRGRAKQAWIAGLFAHGLASELAQYFGNEWFQTGRSGCIRDVVIDWLGITVAWWPLRWWISRKPTMPETSP